MDLGLKGKRVLEVVAGVVFLTGNQASFVSGTNFIVDGAMTARVQY